MVFIEVGGPEGKGGQKPESGSEMTKALGIAHRWSFIVLFSLAHLALQ